MARGWYPPAQIRFASSGVGHIVACNLKVASSPRMVCSLSKTRSWEGGWWGQREAVVVGTGGSLVSLGGGVEKAPVPRTHSSTGLHPPRHTSETHARRVTSFLRSVDCSHHRWRFSTAFPRAIDRVMSTPPQQQKRLRPHTCEWAAAVGKAGRKKGHQPFSTSLSSLGFIYQISP